MIHNSSSDPVLIKKITLKIWTLRDEIEFHLQKKISEKLQSLKNKGDDSISETEKVSLTPHEILELRNYINGTPLENNIIPITTQNQSDNSIESTEEIKEETKENEIIENVSYPEISEEKCSKGKTILSEINMEKMFFFSNKAFTEGQAIVIEFCIPKSFIINADIMYCRPFNLKSRIISQNNLTYRVLVKFKFNKIGERNQLRNFLKSVEPDLTAVSNNNLNSQSESDKSDNSDFNDLDDLGL